MKPIPSVLLLCCSVKEQCIFVDLLQIKDKFRCQESVIVSSCTWGVHLRESVNKRKIQFSFSKVSASTYERVSAYGNA